MDATSRWKFQSDHRVVQWWADLEDDDGEPRVASVGIWRREGADVVSVFHDGRAYPPRPGEERRRPLEEFRRSQWFLRPSEFRRIPARAFKKPVDAPPFDGLRVTVAPCLGETLERCVETYGPPILKAEPEECDSNNYSFQQGELKIFVHMFGNVAGSISYHAERRIPPATISALLKAHAADCEWLIDSDFRGDVLTESLEIDRQLKRADGLAYARHKAWEKFNELSVWSAAYEQAFPGVIK
jgi:hypothetical protein